MSCTNPVELPTVWNGYSDSESRAIVTHTRRRLEFQEWIPSCHSLFAGKVTNASYQHLPRLWLHQRQISFGENKVHRSVWCLHRVGLHRSTNLIADISYKKLATRLVTCIRHLPYEERLWQLGIHSLISRRRQAHLIDAFHICIGPLDMDLNLFFYTPFGAALGDTPTR